MRAVTIHSHGGPDAIAVTDLPVPRYGDDEVLLRLKAAALNRLDLWVLKGWPSLRLDFPHVVGSDGAGIVVEVGEAVSGFKPGDRVAVNPALFCGHCAFCLAGHQNRCLHFGVKGEHVAGFLSEFVVVPAANLLPLPHSITFAQAAAASLVFLTAWHSLIVRGRLQAGETVLIVGAGGGVNTAAIQIAALAGAGSVLVLGSSEEKRSLARELGAGVTLDSTQEQWHKEVFAATKRQGVDVVVDNVGAATFASSLRTLGRGGRLLTVGNTSGPRLELDNRYLFARHLSIIGSTMGTPADFEAVMGLVFAGRLRPVVDSTFPMSEGRAAFQRLASGDVLGKVVVEIQ